MTETDKLLDAIGQIDSEAVLAAIKKRGRARGRKLWDRLAACVGVAAILGAVILASPLAEPAPKLDREDIANIEEVERLYGGTLLTENMTDAIISSISLSHREGTDISDTSGWDTLAFKVDLDGATVDMSCAFNSGGDITLPGKPTKTAEYNGVEVYLYIEEFDGWDERYKYTCEAIFSYEGVRYDMSFRLREADELYDFLDMVMDTPKDDSSSDISSVKPFDNLLGFEDYHVTMAQVTPWTIVWHFWVEIDGVEQCVAEAFGDEYSFGAYSVDLDGNGVPELITNNLYGDGAQEVYVYRNVDGEIMEGSVSRKYYKDELGFDMMVGNAMIAAEHYDAEANEFVVTNYGRDEEKTVTFTGLEHFIFRPFEHQEDN